MIEINKKLLIYLKSTKNLHQSIHHHKLNRQSPQLNPPHLAKHMDDINHFQDME